MVATLGAVALGATGAAPVPLAPGSIEGHRVSSQCPVFSWSRLPQSTDWELVVLRTAGGMSNEEVLVQSLITGSTSWTPPLSRCLARGGEYAWTIRPARFQ